MKKILLASGNQGKLKELQSLFFDLPFELISQPSLEEYHVEETGTTFVENAIIKARHACFISGLPSIADDSGLVVNALNGLPGVHTARYAGIGCSSQDNMNLILEKLRKISDLSLRKATFVCALVYMRNHLDPLPVISVGQWHGAITQKPIGKNGFGYDPLFWDFSQKMTAAQMEKDVKVKLSHRGQACKKLKQKLISVFD